MKNFRTAIVLFFSCTFFSVQGQNNEVSEIASTELSPVSNSKSQSIGDNGFKFEALTTGINSKNSDYGIGFFREKFISFSARKIGAIGRKDPATGEPYTKLYCSDITYEWDLKHPTLFSHILNKYDNLGTIAFSKDGNIIYFTKSQEENTQRFELYTGEMNPEREGQWINIRPVPFNSPEYSIENPHLSSDGKTLYFASDMAQSLGGFDIFQVSIDENGKYGNPERVEGSVNTVLDEKFPHTSIDGKYLYFSSQGHNSIGNFDVFRSRKEERGFIGTRNLGNTINTPNDEIAFIPATRTVGYITSNREGGKGRYDIYKITETIVEQSVIGRTLDAETGTPLPDATVILLDADGSEVNRTVTNNKGEYTFKVDSYLDYTLLSYKEGFERTSASFDTRTLDRTEFTNDLILKAKPAEIVVTEEKVYIKIDNIQFDLNSANIKDISKITLNSVAQTLIENPKLDVAINAHTDKQGSAAYNLKLSDRRAASARAYLISKGISESRMTSKGYGETQLLIECDTCTPEQHEQNRRIEFIILNQD